ncbi:hypothetical protein [Nitrospirillum viridazoti]
MESLNGEIKRHTKVGIFPNSSAVQSWICCRQQSSPVAF